jgi:hypothetical protein
LNAVGSEIIHDAADLDVRLPQIDQQAQLQAGGLQIVQALRKVNFL